MSDGPIRLLLVDGHIAFRELLALRLTQEPDFQVMAEAGSLAEIGQVLSRVEIDVALVDLTLANGEGWSSSGTCAPAIRRRACWW